MTASRLRFFEIGARFPHNTCLSQSIYKRSATNKQCNDCVRDAAATFDEATHVIWRVDIAALLYYLLALYPATVGAALRMRSRVSRTLLLILMFAAFSHDAQANGRIVLLDAAAEAIGDGSRLTFQFSTEPEFLIQTLSDPDRLVIDLPPVDWLRLPVYFERAAEQMANVGSVRYGWFQPGSYRIVLDLAGPVTVAEPSIAKRQNAIELTLSWRGSTHYRQQRFGSLKATPVPRPAPAATLDRQKPLIVLDPGHGGVDPGAIGTSGIKEKDITLRAAKLVAEHLRNTGRYEVQLTRTDDRFLKLHERIDIARREKADLFISLHANSAGSDIAHGLSVYSLSEKASDHTAAALARRENKADVLAGVDLSGEEAIAIPVLIDLAQRETRNRSVRFANRIVESALTRVPILSRAHRQAGFAVLKAPDVPAVLVELGFLSNADEEQLLNSAIHLSQIAEGLTAAVDGYFAIQSADRR